MKKRTKTVEAFKAQNKAKEITLNSLKAKLTANTLSEEARADAEALIAEKEAEIQAIKDMIDELEADEEDKSEELIARLAEMTAKIEEIENGLKAPKGLIKVQNFIQSKEGEKAFMQVVQNSANGKEFKANWKAKLAENGITPADVMLPPAILQEVNDTWEKSAENFLSLLDVTGLVAYKVLTDTNADDTSRAQGHIKGKEKNEQVVDLTPKEIRAQFVYKYITIDRETVEYEDTTGALMRFISRELAERVIHEIMRAVLVGDGRTGGAEGKISKIEAVTAASALYQTTTTSAAAVPTIEEVATAVDSIDAEGDIVLFMSKQTFRSLSGYTAAAGGTVQYRTREEIADQLGVSQIITTRILRSPAAGGASVIAFVGKAYKIVGDLTMRGFENFILSYNKNEYLTEVYVGGALAVPASGAVIVAPEEPEED